MAKKKRKVRQNKRKKDKRDKSNPVAKAVRSDLYKPKVVEDKTKFKRKPKHKGKIDE